MDKQQIDIHSTPLWKASEWFPSKASMVHCYYHYLGNSIGLHQNEFYEMDIVVAGKGTHVLAKQEIAVSPGYVCIIPPQMQHGYLNNENLNVFHALIRSAFLERYFQELQSLPGFTLLFEISPYIAKSNAGSISFRMNEESFSEIVPDIDALVSLNNDPYKGKHVHASARMLCLLAILSSKVYDAKRNIIQAQNPNTQIVLESIEYIRTNSEQDLSVEELVKRSNMSRSTYTRIFKELTGCMPRAFLLRCRVTNAKRLLSYTNMPMASIAQECGFFDSSHFIRIFTRQEGISPSAYRQLHANKASYAACSLCPPPSGSY